MATRYALRHHSSRRWLTTRPSLGLGYRLAPSEADAASYSTMTEAELERLGLDSFAGSWDVVPISVASIYDDPQETVKPPEDK